MKIEKKLWITLFAFGIFAICFSGWIFRQSTAREKLFWDNTIRCETKELKEGEIKSENIALPEDFDVPKSILFKTTHTIAEVWLDGEKIYEYGNEADAPGFMKTPGSCWHIVDIPGDSSGKNLEVTRRLYSENLNGQSWNSGDQLWNPVCRCYLHTSLLWRSAKKKKRQDRSEN